MLSAATAASGQQPAQPTRDAAAAKAGTAQLSGRVTALATGKPIARAVVLISSPTVPEGRGVSTDADGRWALDNLPAGSYNVSISKNGFLTLSYGQRRPFTPGTPIKLLNGEAMTKVDVALPRASAIAGRIVDELGEPVAGAGVSVQRQGFANGVPRLTSVGPTDTTDDLGAFRVHGLPTGDYYVVVTPPRRAILTAFDDRTGYARTYFPDAHSPAQATRLSLATGEDVRELMVTMVPTRMVTVSGTAVDAAGKPLDRAIGTLRERSNRVAPSREFFVSGGQWSATGVVPGEYVLSLQWIENIETVAVSGSTVGRKREYAEMAITVGSEDVRGISLATGAAGTASGRIHFEGTAPANPFVSAYVHGVDSTGYSPAGSGRVGVDGTFRVEGLSGERLFRVDQALERDGWILKSVILKGRDITDTPIATPFGTDLSGLEVTLAKDGGELSGTVTTSKGTHAEEFIVIVFPPEPERWGPHSRQIKTGRPDHTGRFSIANLPPATYLVAALEYIEPGPEMNRDFLETLKTDATRITLGEREKKAVTLKLASN